MAKRQNNKPAVKAGTFSNYSQWWLSGGDISQLMNTAVVYSNTPYGRIQAATYNVWAANCIAARSETLAGVDLKLYKRTKDPQQKPEEITDHPVLELLEEVNPVNLQKASFREQIERQLSIHGDCYIHKVRDAKGLVAEMYILPAQYVEPIPDAVKMVAGYRYQTSIVLPPEDVVRIYYSSDENPALARSPISSAIAAINNYVLSDLAQRGIDQRGGQGGGIVMVDFNSIAGDPQRFMQEWDAKRSDPHNAGRDAFLPSESSYTSGTLTAQQQQREERAMRLIREIMAAFRVPPSLAGDYKDASVLSNAAQQDKNFWQTFMRFELKRVEESMNVGLLWGEYKGSREDGLYLLHDTSKVEALSEGEDAESNRDGVRATTADTAFASGLISLNEARVYIGQEPIDDPRADEVLQPETEPEMPQGADIANEDPELDALLEEASAVKAATNLLLEVGDFLEDSAKARSGTDSGKDKSAGGFATTKQRKWYFANKDKKKGSDKASSGYKEQSKDDASTDKAVENKEAIKPEDQLHEELKTKDAHKKEEESASLDGKKTMKEYGNKVETETHDGKPYHNLDGNEEYEIHKWGDAAMMPKLEGEQAKALKGYTSEHIYSHIASVLRNDDYHSKNKEEYSDEDVAKNIANLDKAMKVNKTPENLIVFRGAKFFNPNFKVGSTVQDDAFVSTSFSKKVANGFTFPNPYDEGKPNLQKVVYKVSVPKGTNAIWTDGHTAFTNEQELILNRGAKFKIKSIDKSKPTYEVEAEYVE